MATYLSFMIAAPIISQLLRDSTELLDAVWSDPQKRNETLLELSEKSEKNHEKVLGEISKNRKEFEELNKKREDAVNERLRIQKEENAEAVKEKMEESEKQNRKHEEEIKLLEKEHKEKISKMQSETKEAKEKAEEEHKLKISQKEEEHKQKIEEAEVEMKKIKEEGEEKIREAEEEVEKVEEEKRKNLYEFMEKQKLAEKEHLNVKEEMKQIIRNLKMENMKKRKEQIAVEDKNNLDHLNLNFNALLKYIDVDNTRKIIEKFKLIGVPFSSIRDSLENIKILCIPLDGSDASFLDLTVEADIQNIINQKASYKFKVEQYQKLLLNRGTSDRKLLDTCSKLINEINELVMKETAIPEIQNHLPKAIEEKDIKKVKKYGEAAKKCSEKFTKTNSSLDTTIQKFLTDFSHNDVKNLSIRN